MITSEHKRITEKGSDLHSRYSRPRDTQKKKVTILVTDRISLEDYLQRIIYFDLCTYLPKIRLRVYPSPGDLLNIPVNNRRHPRYPSTHHLSLIPTLLVRKDPGTRVRIRNVILTVLVES